MRPVEASPSVTGLTLLRWVLLTVRLERRLVGAITLAGVMAGIVYACLAPVEYVSETRILPELQARSALNLKRFGALAEMAGIDLPGVTNIEAVRPDLFPDVLKSTPFVLHILRQPVTTLRQQKYPSLAGYLTAGGTGWLPRLLGNGAGVVPPASGDKTRLTVEQEDLVNEVKKRVLSELDRQTGIIIIRVKMPDPEIAAQVNQQAVRYLTRYVIDYRTEKSRQDLLFLQERRREARRRYEQAMLNLTRHQDRHRYLVSQVAGIAERNLLAEFELSQMLYNNLTRDYEQVRLKVQEETPILKVLEPPQVPAKRSSPQRLKLVLLFGLLGGLAGVAWGIRKNVNQNKYEQFSGATGTRIG